MDYISEIKLLTYDSCDAPVFTAAAGDVGNLTAGTYVLKITSVTKFGESLSATSLSFTIPAGGGGSIDGTIYKADNAVKYRVYINSVLQSEVTQLADDNTLFTVHDIVSGSAIPTADTATIHLSAANYASALASATAEYYNRYSVDEIDTDHEYGVVYLAASFACLSIAAKYAHTSNKLINADSVDYKMRADDFRKMAAEYKKKSKDILQIGQTCGTLTTYVDRQKYNGSDVEFDESDPEMVFSNIV